MKKIAALILSTIMLFALAASSLANSVSLGYLVNGEAESDGQAGKFRYDAKDYILGCNFKISDKFSMSGELTDCEIDASNISGNIYDESSFKIKGSYAIIKKERVRFDLSAGYLYHESTAQQEKFEWEYRTFILGTDAIFGLAKNINVTAGFEYGLSPEGNLSHYDYKKDANVDSLLNYQVDFNYIIAKYVGLSLGYRSSCWEIEDGAKSTIGGIETKVTYRF